LNDVVFTDIFLFVLSIKKRDIPFKENILNASDKRRKRSFSPKKENTESNSNSVCHPSKRIALSKNQRQNWNGAKVSHRRNESSESSSEDSDSDSDDASSGRQMSQTNKQGNHLE